MILFPLSVVYIVGAKLKNVECILGQNVGASCACGSVREQGRCSRGHSDAGGDGRGAVFWAFADNVLCPEQPHSAWTSRDGQRLLGDYEKGFQNRP